jgi:hypothetical protein
MADGARWFPDVPKLSWPGGARPRSLDVPSDRPSDGAADSVSSALEHRGIPAIRRKKLRTASLLLIEKGALSAIGGA